MNFKRGKRRTIRAGCKLCKPWKMNGVRTESQEGEAFSDHRRRESAETEAEFWDKEIVRRVEEIRSGMVQLIPWEEVKKELRQKSR